MGCVLCSKGSTKYPGYCKRCLGDFFERLKQLRVLAVCIHIGKDADFADLTEEAENFATLWDDLDEWLTKAGIFPPAGT